jgi:transcriptional regulator with XRE-family HTH domain
MCVLTGFLAHLHFDRVSRMTKMKARRQELRLTQTAVGYLSGVSPSDVSRIENGRMIPYPAQADKIAKVLKLRIEELQQHTNEAVSA